MQPYPLRRGPFDLRWLMYRSYSETYLSQGSAKLYEFLTQTKTPSTHFFIGYYIKLNPALFTSAFEELDADIAVHTWSHRHMTTLSNLDIVSELGWTMEIIKNSTVSALGRFPITQWVPLSSQFPGRPAATVLATPIW